jgi:hypothetical protein
VSNLTPVQRPDKNGHIVTRHVRVENPPPASLSALRNAAPVLTTLDRARITDEVAILLDNDEVDLSPLKDQDLANLSVLMEDLDNERNAKTVRELMQSFVRDSYLRDKAHKVKDDLQNLALYQRVDRDISLDETLCFTRGLHAYQPLFGGYTAEQNQIMIDVSIVALRMLGEKTNSFEYPEDDMDGEFRTDLDMYYSFFGGDVDDQRDSQLWIRNKKFVDMMERRPEDIERICEIIKQRETVQPDIIETMLDSDNHEALIEGTL